METQPYQLFNNNAEEGISENFIQILKKCSNPHLICLYGELKNSNKTILNQIINGIISNDFLNLKKPFELLKESEESSNGCNIYGPVKIIDLINKNKIDENQISKDIINDELFFVEIKDFKHLFNSRQSLIDILAILLISSIRIIDISNFDYGKLEIIKKINNLSSILNLKKEFNEEGETIALIQDISLKEKVETKLLIELKNKKNLFETKINDYLLYKKCKTKVICEVLPSYQLVINEVGNYPTCYKIQIKNLIVSILSSLKYNKEINGQKVLDSINIFLEILKKIHFDNFKQGENILNIILTELFKQKIDKIYLNIVDKVNQFDKKIICLIGKIDLIKSFLIDEIKKQLNGNYEIYENSIHNEISSILEIYILKLDLMIKENFYKIKDKINEELIFIYDINGNKKILEYLSKINYQEEININDIKNIIEEEINHQLISKYPSFFECIEIIEKNYKNNIINNTNIQISNYLNNLYFNKPKWENILNLFISEIDKKIINNYKNRILEQNSFREIEREINSNFENLKREIDIYTVNNKFNFYNKKDFINKLQELFIKLKKELSIQLIILKERNQKIIEKSIPNGIYNIIPYFYGKKSIEIKDNNTEKNSYLQLEEFNNSLSQQFEIKYSPINQFYIIKSLYSNKFLSIDYANNNNIILLDKHFGNTQQWHIVSKDDGYEIISELNGFLMDINENNNLTSIISCKPKSGKLNQLFQFKFSIPSSQTQLTKPQSLSSIQYFIRVSYDGVSIADALHSIGIDNSFNYRKKIAEKNKIEGYSGTPNQNIYMLNLLKQGLLIKP